MRNIYETRAINHACAILEKHAGLFYRDNARMLRTLTVTTISPKSPPSPPQKAHKEQLELPRGRLRKLSYTDWLSLYIGSEFW